MIRAKDQTVNGRPVQTVIDTLPARISQPILAWAHQASTAPAVQDRDVLWSYEDLAHAVSEAKELLITLAVRPGDRIMLVNENCRSVIALVLAASELDVWPSVVSARLTVSEIDNIIDNYQPRRVFYTTDVSTDAQAHATHHKAVSHTSPRLGRLAIGPLQAVQAELVHADPAQQVAVVIYTSGTVGRPKGVMLTHQGILFVAAVSGGLRALHAKDRVYGVLPMSHVFGFSSMCIGTLYAGACLHLSARFSPVDTIQALSEAGISVLQGVPAMYARLLEHFKMHGIKPVMPQLRYISAGGSPLDLVLKEQVEKVFHLTLHNGYGLTENSPTMSQTRLDADIEGCTVGPLLPGLEARIVDRSGHDVPVGEVGELWARGPTVMKGYYRNPEETAATLHSEGWLKTGDLAYVDEADNLFISGRSKELIIRSGFNVYPAEVEAVLNAHPDVTLSAVVGLEADANELVIAFVQWVPGSDMSIEQLQSFAATRLAPYKRPARIIPLETLPASSTGKILKAKLKEMAKRLVMETLEGA